MRRPVLLLLVAAALLASSPASSAAPPPAPAPQSAQAGTDSFDGTWVGSGRIARPIFRSWCGDGPLVKMTIQDGAARAVFKAFAKGKARAGLRSYVITLTGVVEGDGALTLTGYEASATLALSARDGTGAGTGAGTGEGTGEGTWEFRRLACYGNFRVRRKP